jgi:hypothetical protein
MRIFTLENFKNMKKYLLLLLLPLFALLSGCDSHKHNEGPTADFDVTFKATYEGQQLSKNTDYNYGAFPLLFVRYRLYLSDITLLKAGEEVRLSEVEYLDFTPESAPSDLSATPKKTYSKVPEGEYDGIRIGYGVKADLNKKRPSDFPVGHPLYDETDYWSGWKSYIFSVLDGKADPDDNGSKDLNFSYHCGADGVYKTFTFSQPIHVHQGQEGLTIEFDLKKVLTMSDGSLYNIVDNSATSNDASNLTVALALMSNYGNATNIKQ